MRIGHLVERYPVPQHDFIRHQVVRGDGRDDVLLALRAGAHDEALPVVALRRGDSTLTDRLRQRLLWSAHRRSAGAFVRTAARDHGLDLVHAHFGMAGAAACDAGVPLVTSFYGVDASACLRSDRWLARFRPLFERGDLFLVLSDPLVERLAAAGCPRERVAVIDLAVDVEAYVPRAPDIDPSAPRVLCAARFVEKKGHPLLIEAFAGLRRRAPGARLTLAGYGPLLGQIRATVAERGLADAVEVVDTSEEGDFTALLARLIASHDIFVLPSIVAADGDDEAGPALTAVCAQAAGMPVVLTPFVGAERSVEHERTGLLAAPDPAALEAAIERIAGDPALAADLGRRASALVRDRFSVATMRRALATYYARVLDAARS